MAAGASSCACVFPREVRFRVNTCLFSRPRTPSAPRSNRFIPTMYSRTYKPLVSLPPLLWVGLFLLLPYGLMFAHSFWAVHDGVLVHQWNLHNYSTLFSKPVYVEVLLRTMRIAASVTLFSLLLGYPLAYYLSFHGGARKELLYQLVIVPLWVSYLVPAYPWKTLLGTNALPTRFLHYLLLPHNP